MLVCQSFQLFVILWTVACQALFPWDSSGKNTGVGCQFLLQGITPTQESNLGVLHRRQILYWLSYAGSPVRSWVIRKDPGAWKDWRQEETGTTEDEMVGWHHQFNGHEFKQTLGDDEEQGSLWCCNLLGSRVGHDWATEQQQLELPSPPILVYSRKQK